MTSPPVVPRPEDVSTVGVPIKTFDGLHEALGGFGAQLSLARQQALDFRAEFATSGRPDSVDTFDLISLPYPTRMGLWRAARTPAPFLTITNRMLVVRWSDGGGRTRTLLFEPSDHELGRNTPYFAALAAKTPKLLQRVMSTEHAAVPDQLRAAGIDPADVDYLAFDGSVVIGPGVALLATPGHVLGNQTLVLHTDTGIWASSENAIATECLTPEHSRIPGVAKWARTWQQEVILNANTLETTAQQYNSMVIEKTIVDRAQADPRFLQFFPSSELTAHMGNPGTRPTFTHRAITHHTARHAA